MFIYPFHFPEKLIGSVTRRPRLSLTTKLFHLRGFVSPVALILCFQDFKRWSPIPLTFYCSFSQPLLADFQIPIFKFLVD